MIMYKIEKVLKSASLSKLNYNNTGKISVECKLIQEKDLISETFEVKIKINCNTDNIECFDDIRIFEGLIQDLKPLLIEGNNNV